MKNYFGVRSEFWWIVAALIAGLVFAFVAALNAQEVYRSYYKATNNGVVVGGYAYRLIEENTPLYSELITTLTTNWVPVTTFTETKEVGVVIETTRVRTIHDGATNDWVRKSVIVGQENVRSNQPTSYTFFVNSNAVVVPSPGWNPWSPNIR